MKASLLFENRKVKRPQLPQSVTWNRSSPCFTSPDVPDTIRIQGYSPERNMADKIDRRTALINLGVCAAASVAPVALSGCSRDVNAASAHHPAKFWTAGKGGTVTCNLCPRECETEAGESGFCRARKNEQGKYYTLAYQNPVAVHNDPIEKKPVNHVLPGTTAFSVGMAGCNLRCKHCQNWQISQSAPGDLASRDIPPRKLAELGKQAGSSVLAFTYNEPTTFPEYIIDSAIQAKNMGLGAVMVSNGFINEKPQRELLKHLTAYKVDLKGFSEKFYTEICGASIKPVLASLERIRKAGMWLEIVNLVIPTLNDQEEDLTAMAAWIVANLGPDVPIHFTRFHPMYKIRNLPPTPISTLEKAHSIAKAQGVHYAYIGNVPGHKAGHTYCHHCGEMLIRRYAYDVEIKTLSKGKCGKCGTSIPGVWKQPA
jgi:pyruvate formate lyase activating enzyme